MKTQFALIIFSLCMGTAKGQFWKDKLNQVTESVKRKAENKLDEKINHTVDSGIDKVDDALSKNKTPRTDKKQKTNSRNEESSVSNNENRMKENYSDTQTLSTETTISTNIKCIKGAELVEELIRGKNGVLSVSVDSSKGNIFLSYDNSENKNLLPEILNLVRDQGFSANGKPATSKTNLCK